jgi:hypothetical protein
MDAVTASYTEKPRILPPEDEYQAVCVDGIDLGLQHNEKYAKLEHKYALVFQLNALHPETGKRFEVAERFTVSMSEKAKLRAFLGSWRNKPYGDEEARGEIPLHKLDGVNAIVVIAHSQSKVTGKTYANIYKISPLPKGTAKMVAADYERAPYWADVQKQAAQPQTNEDTFPRALEDDDDDLPF